MTRARPTPRYDAPKRPPPGGGRLRVWARALRERATIERPGRLAMRGGLAALAVATLVLLVTVSQGGLNRFGLQRLAADIPAAARPPARPGYLSR